MAVELRAVVREELGKRAPEIAFESVDPKVNLREAFDIDSMDFLNFVIGLSGRLGLDIPEQDYPEIETIEGALAYLERKISVARNPNGAVT